MYLFTRRTRITSADALEWATEIAGAASKVSGHDIDLWGTVYSAAYGTISWTAWFEDLPSLEAFGDKIAADPGYQSLAQQGTALTNGMLDDGLLQLVAGEPQLDLDLQYVTGVAAVCAGGHAEQAMTAGVQIAEKATALTGSSTLFMRGVTGPYGSVGWITGHADIASIERAESAMAADPTWLSLVDSTGDMFVEDPLITQSTMYRKLA